MTARTPEEWTMTDQEIKPYLLGNKLVGDDFNAKQINAWFAAEQEGYANLGAKSQDSYRYEYHALNRQLGFKHLPPTPLDHVLGFGSAYGEELLPVLSRARSVTIVDPSGAFASESIHGVPVAYVKPAATGELALPTASVDLITCLGVLHHIPNVTAVVRELARVLRPGGHMLLREPIVSMGDWRRPRHGLTKNERGIPLQLLERAVAQAELQVVRTSLCGFPVTERLFGLFCKDVYNSPAAVWADAKVSALFRWNVNYHAQTIAQRLRPTSAFMVVRKP